MPDSGWTIETLAIFFQRQLDDFRLHLDERYTNHLREVDTSIESAKAIVRHAMDASDKAVHKAEIAADKRFESVNEFRAQLADQASTFMTRSESDAKLNAAIEVHKADVAYITERFQALDVRLTERAETNQRRLDGLMGEQAGLQAAQAAKRVAIGQLIALCGVIVAVVTFAIGLYITR